MRHVELVDALKAAGLDVVRGERVGVGLCLWYTQGGERQNVEWIGPKCGDGDLDFVTTNDVRGGLGFSLRSLRLAVAFVEGKLFAWEAAFAERVQEVERMEATTSERARNGRKTKSGATAAVVLLGRRPADPPL